MRVQPGTIIIQSNFLKCFVIEKEVSERDERETGDLVPLLQPHIALCTSRPLSIAARPCWVITKDKLYQYIERN